jgi:hypothetical protein
MFSYVFLSYFPIFKHGELPSQEKRKEFRKRKKWFLFPCQVRCPIFSHSKWMIFHACQAKKGDVLSAESSRIERLQAFKVRLPPRDANGPPLAIGSPEVILIKHGDWKSLELLELWYGHSSLGKSVSWRDLPWPC